MIKLQKFCLVLFLIICSFIIYNPITKEVKFKEDIKIAEEIKTKEDIKIVKEILSKVVENNETQGVYEIDGRMVIYCHQESCSNMSPEELIEFRKIPITKTTIISMKE